MSKSSKQSMTLREFASRMNVNPVTVRNWLRKDLIPGAVYHPPGDRGGAYWEIPYEALAMKKPKRGSEAGSYKKFNISIEEFRNLVMQGKTQEEIGQISGVTRERVRQLYNKYLRAEFGVGWIRRVSLNDELRERKRDEDAKKKPKLALLKSILDVVGLKFEVVAGQYHWLAHPSKVLINGYRCKLYWCKTALPTHEKSNHIYYRANGAGDSVEWADFLIVMCGFHGEQTFVLPSKLVRETYPSYRTIMHIPAERYEVYNNQYPKLPWWNYYEAWSQLDGEAVETVEDTTPYVEPSQTLADVVEIVKEEPYLQDALKSSHKITYKLIVQFQNKISDDPAPALDIWTTNKIYYNYKDLLDAAVRYRSRKGSEYTLFYLTIRDKDPSSIMIWPFGKDLYGGTDIRRSKPDTPGIENSISPSASSEIADCEVVELPGSTDQPDAVIDGHRRSLDQHEVGQSSGPDPLAGFIRITDDYPPPSSNSVQQ